MICFTVFGGFVTALLCTINLPVFSLLMELLALFPRMSSESMKTNERELVQFFI